MVDITKLVRIVYILYNNQYRVNIELDSKKLIKSLKDP